MQYVNERAVVEVNVPAVVSAKLRVKCMRHENTCARYTVNAWAPHQVKAAEEEGRNVDKKLFSVAAMLAPKSPPSVAK